jgi:hypothetical protein
MAVTYANTLKDTRMTAVITAIDAGASPGTLEICTAAYATVLAVVALAKPSFTEASQQITMASTPRSGAASASGTASVARLKDSNNNVIINNLTVGTTGSDINLSSTAVTSGQTVSITSGAITHG